MLGLGLTRSAFGSVPVETGPIPTISGSLGATNNGFSFELTFVGTTENSLGIRFQGAINDGFSIIVEDVLVETANTTLFAASSTPYWYRCRAESGELFSDWIVAADNPYQHDSI